MYIYWRIQQDLNCLGETIHFHEPCFIRSLQRWTRLNIAGLSLAEDQGDGGRYSASIWQEIPAYKGLVH
jgi:hypothetical protein